MNEAGQGIGGPCPAQVCHTQGGTNQHSDAASPNGMAEVGLGYGG